MINFRRKPAILWITQVTIFALILWLVFLLAISFIRDTNAVTDTQWIIFLGFLLLQIATLYGIAKRKIWGNWLSIFTFTLIFLVSSVFVYDAFFPRSDMIFFSGWSTIIPISFQVLILSLILSLIFSQKVKGFFRIE